MITSTTRQRIDDLLRNPTESLNVEIKSWLDINNSLEDKATLAKAIIALANHGGGIVLIGFEEKENGYVPSANCPESLAGFTTDSVNAVVRRYAEPEFHCDTYIATSPDDQCQYPTVVVPGGHQAPIRAKRSGPNNKTIMQDTYYIRRPGPQSQAPQSGREWDELMRRCITNARDNLLDQFRLIMAGGATEPIEENDQTRLQAWFSECLERWKTLTRDLQPDNVARFPNGYYATAYILADVQQTLAGTQLLEALRLGVVRHTGWPPFLVPTKKELEPYPYDGNVECWIGGTIQNHGPASADFWRVSPDGMFFLIRGYEEDGYKERQIAPGTIFDISFPTWRLGEILLHASSMARQFESGDTRVLLKVQWTGLAKRKLDSIANPNRVVPRTNVSQQADYSANIEAQANQIAETLPELVDSIVRPLYGQFDFFQLPAQLVVEELSSMRKNQF